MRILIEAIKANAINRPEGYIEDVLSHGIVDGEFLEITQEGYNELLKKYRVKMRGMGDVVAKVAQPIAKGLDKVFRTHIQGCGGCAKRQDKLNKVFPFK